MAHTDTEQHMLVGKMAVPNIQQLLQALLSTDNDTRSKAEVKDPKGEQIYNKSLEKCELSQLRNNRLKTDVNKTGLEKWKNRHGCYNSRFLLIL